MPSPAQLPCGVCWALSNFFLVGRHSQTGLPGPGTTAICWALVGLLHQLHPLDATVLSPAELLMSRMGVWSPRGGWNGSCEYWGHRGLPKEYKYGPKSNRWKLQILSPTVTYLHHIHETQILVTSTMLTLQLSLPWPIGQAYLFDLPFPWN